MITSCQYRKADWVVFNANVYTVNDSFEKVTAFAIKDGKFLSVGGDEIIDLYPNALKFDARGLPIYPGFIDAHCHFFNLGLSLAQVDLRGSKSIGEIEKRPWGNYHIIARNLGYQIKEIKVSVNSKLSLQKHNYRAEFWQIIKGKCKVTVGNKKQELNDNDHIYIPNDTFHRIENIGNDELIFIEIQLGEDIKEDDIIRIEDDYGRV